MACNPLVGPQPWFDNEDTARIQVASHRTNSARQIACVPDRGEETHNGIKSFANVEGFHWSTVHAYTGSLLCDFYQLSVEIESLAVELTPEVFEVFAGSTRNIKEAPGLRDPSLNGIANPCRFAGVVLEGIGEIVEVGRLVEHVQKCDRRGEAIVSLPVSPGACL